MIPPEELGTVVWVPGSESRGRHYVLLDPLEQARERWLEVGSNPRRWVSWDSFAVPGTEVVHRGWVRSTPEPLGWGAVVRCADGQVFKRTDFDHWAPPLSYGPAVSWRQIAQPVVILFAGVDV